MKKIVIILALIIFSNLISSSAFSQLYLHLYLSIDRSDEVSLSTYYFYSKDYQNFNVAESEENETCEKVKIIVLDENNKIINNKCINYSEDEFYTEVFDLRKGKRIEEVSSIVKNTIIFLPNNSKILEIYSKERKVKEFRIDLKNMTLKSFENLKNSEENIERKNEEINNQKTPLLFAFLLILCIVIFVLFLIFKRRRALSTNYQ
ncbi:MAG: hypothetical protein QXT34_01480 [Candidatus Aenigmatarchaeota archaeon]